MMNAGRLAVGSILLTLAPLLSEGQDRGGGSDGGYLTWTAAQAQQVGRSTRVTGRISGNRDLLHTERALSYKLRATWLTSEVVRATARLAQLSEGLSNEQTRALVRDAEAAGDTIIMVEIDPREGSGVIPLDWVTLLGPKGSRSSGLGAVKGVSVPRLREIRGLSGTFRRDYDYEVFWVVFPPTSDGGKPVFPTGVAEAELVVRIYNGEGRVKWSLPESIRRRSRVNED